jgi:ATP-dependent Lon protease
MKADKRIMLIAQKQPDVDDPKGDDLYRIGTVATILQLLKLPDGTVKVLVEGVDRARIDTMHTGEHYTADVTTEPDADTYDEKELDVLARSVISQFEQYVKLNKKVPPEVLTALAGIEQPGRLADTVPRTWRSSSREAEGPGDPRRAQAPRARAGRHRRRDGRAADREAHPRPRQGADGEEPARVLPE